MMKVNEILPDIEMLGQDEFNLDTEEQRRLQAEGEGQVQQIREEMELEDLAKMYMRETIKNECWDSMINKGRSIKAFHFPLDVSNYPMRERSKKEKEDLEFVTNVRRIEVAEMAARKEIIELGASTSGENEEGDEESEEGEAAGDPAAITGSLGAQYGGANELFYSQFELHTRQQKNNQIVLLQDAIYRIKQTYNKIFDEVYKQREQEIARIEEKNVRITKILSDLTSSEKIWQPGMDADEKPEKLLTVEDSEVSGEKFVSADQKAKMEEEAKLEEEKKLAAKGDNARERALDMMMGGVLEIKKEDELKKDIPIPIFMTVKGSDEWSDEEKKIAVEFEKRVKELSEEREKYKKTLEAELKKLQTIIADTTANFDEKLMTLFAKKVKTELAIFQEELKILRLSRVLMVEDELDAREEELTRLLNAKRSLKASSVTSMAQAKKQVEQYRDTYDIRVAEDKVMEKNFRKEFHDVHPVLVDQLFKLYRRRPRGQKHSGENEEGDEESEEGEAAGDPAAITGSLGAQYGGANDLFYSQFELHTRQQKNNQIVLLQDAIYRIKQTYNKIFDEVYKQREQEIARIEEKNVRITKILSDLTSNEKIWQPGMDADEKPEKLLTVEDSEVSGEKFTGKMEEEAKLEEEKKLAANGDNARERALDMMMGGVLEIKKEDELKKDIPIPIFMTVKGSDEWSDEEKKIAVEFEKRVKELSEEREKYKKTLEAELKKLQTIIADTTANFDEKLMTLFAKKVKTELAIFQEELKILRLSRVLMVEDELDAREEELTRLLNAKRSLKASSVTSMAQAKKQVEQYRDTYDIRVAEDKVMEKNFRKEFHDVHPVLVDQLFKLYRRRPRGQKHARKGSPTTETPVQAAANPYGERPLSARQPHTTASMVRALEELNDESHMPEGIEPHTWKHMCDLRTAKVIGEQEVKAHALTLADMNGYLQRRQEEDERLRGDIDDLLESLNRITAMKESKDFRKGIHILEWEHKKMIMQIEDLLEKAKLIQMLKVSRELQGFLHNEDLEGKKQQQIQTLEHTLENQRGHHDKTVGERKQTITKLKHVIRQKQHDNSTLDRELEEMTVMVSERKHINNVNAAARSDTGSAKRMQDIVQRRKLVDLAKAQAQEVAVLRAEVERLRMRTFPALVQVER
eukprot:XP_011680959.1 PREDICTED: cilia- and flagella-associated protein 43 [Strongylocentrotus purpuratus]